MEKYLDPKADLTFKKIFGEHPDLVMSLLNALLPLPEGQEITSIEYLPSEMVPETPLRKNSIVDVRCQDTVGRQFIVEMQMVWSKEFQRRVLFNASKAYVRQLEKREKYELLEPVYSLNLVNEVFETGLEGFYHYYRLVHEQDSNRVIDGLHLVFVELPKFTPHTFTEKKTQLLWLRFMTEIDENTESVPLELLSDPLVNKAVSIVRESAFSRGQLEAYDRFWDAIRVEKALVSEGERRGKEIGFKKGFQRGEKEGFKKGEETGFKKGEETGFRKGEETGFRKGEETGFKKGEEKGRFEEQLRMAQNCKSLGMDLQTIARLTNLPIEEILRLN